MNSARKAKWDLITRSNDSSINQFSVTSSHLWGVHGDAGADYRKGKVQPKQISSLSQGQHRETINHPHTNTSRQFTVAN